ncbi:hypothetical protein WICPIJ_008802 [Wickerhamomyces pijperi]|uniref:Uncharacterized protein n=1 Tax=Wickerhamomyces pijperi TaxID=599730 RepID=A0A9P8THI2_WICPI|nr:hypothetical protein WICPIJ_008802 [Wickerhamomyces pijperi]
MVKRPRQMKPKALMAQANPTAGYSFFKIKGKIIPPTEPPTADDTKHHDELSDSRTVCCSDQPTTEQNSTDTQRIKGTLTVKESS